MLLLSPSLAKRSFVSTQLHRNGDSRAIIVSSVAVVGFPSDDDESAAPASSVIGRGDWDWDEFIMIAEASETCGACC